MPMIADYRLNEARDAARMLASMTLDGLRSRDPAGARGNAINNMYRLLQGYRSHGFCGLMTSADRSVGDMKLALDETFAAVFGGVDPGAAIEGMKGVLRMVAYPVAGESPDPEDMACAERFFSAFLGNLDRVRVLAAPEMLDRKFSVVREGGESDARYQSRSELFGLLRESAMQG
jgi:hypothetical protein